METGNQTNNMSKRNFILLIIILGLVILGVFGFLYFRPAATTPVDTTGTNFISQFNPFGNNKPTTAPPATTPPVDVSGLTPAPASVTAPAKLVKVSSMPIAGFTVFSKERLKDVPVTENGGVGIGNGVSITIGQETISPTVSKNVENKKPTPPATEFVPALRYVDKASGNIYQTFADKIEERQFSTTIIPKVYDSYFGNTAESVVMRYLKDDATSIETFIGALPKELLGGDTTGNNEIKGSFLPTDVKDISASPDGSKIFYLFESGNDMGDSMAGVTLNLLNNKKVQIFSSPFTEWLSQWPTSNMITLTTKPSANVLGYMYTIDSAGKNLTKILGDIDGLTTLTSPNGKLVLYADNNLSLNIYHIDTRNSDTLGIKTLPEKCVWGKLSDSLYCAVPKSIPGAQYPDDWYQGEISFTDQIWKIDVKTRNGTIVLDPGTITGGEEADGTKLALDDSENYLFFVNKKDSLLWELALK